MKKTAGILLAAAGLCAGAAYWVDLMNFTDLSSGFVTVGSVWLRYGTLALLLAVGVLGVGLAVRRPAALERRSLPLGLLALLAALVYAALGGIQIACGLAGAQEAALQLVQGVLALITALSLLMRAAAWLAGSAGCVPAGGVGLGVAGTLYFLLLTFVRFAVNDSSLYRFAQTVQTFNALLALLFASTLVRAGCLPESRWGRRLYLTGIWAFYLCTCCEAPQALARWMAGQIQLADLAASLGLGCIGLLGADCALAALVGKASRPSREDA